MKHIELFFIPGEMAMPSILINPKNRDEYLFIEKLISKMNIQYTVLSDEDKEDLGLSLLMKKADRSQKASRQSVIQRTNQGKKSRRARYS